MPMNYRVSKLIVSTVLAALLVALVLALALLQLRARMNLEECTRVHGYTVECLTKYETERIGR